MEEHAAALYDAVAGHLGAFVEHCVAARLPALSPAQLADAEAAGRRAEEAVLPRLARLLEADLDHQATTPLAVVRQAVAFATEVLDRHGAPAVARDRFEQDRFPTDRYGLVPASLDALGEEVGEVAIAWGAWKAMAHKARHGA